MRLFVLITGLLLLGTLSAQWREVQFDDSDMALDLTEAFTFQKYPTYDQYVEMMQSFAADYPQICRLDTFGTSVEGRLLLALKISDQPGLNEPEANFLYTSTIHGDELVGFILLLRLADTLLKGYGTDKEITGLVDGLTVWINPLANPDGSYAKDNNISLKQSDRENINGIDLNRGFPDPAYGEADDTTGRARENQAMMLFMKQHGITLSANLHSGEEVVNYPWDHDSARIHVDDSWYRFISREYADEAKAVDADYMALFTDGITHGGKWYEIPGGRQDYVNYYLAGREVTLELSLTYRLGSEFLEEYWNINRRSLLNYMAQCTYGIRGRVTEMENGEPVRALISIPGHDSAYSVVHSFTDHGDYYRLIKEGVYDLVFSAPGFISDTINGVSVTDHQATWLDVELEKDPATGLPSLQSIPEFRIYPNPVQSRLYMEPRHVQHGPLEIMIHGSDGRQFLRRTCLYTGHPVLLPTETLPGGFYILNITSQEVTRGIRFVKQ